MSKRSLGLMLVCLVVSLGSAAHAATFDIAPNPVDVGKIRVGASGNTTGKLTASVATQVKLVKDAGGDCAQFNVTPTTPFTADPDGFDLSVEFNPTSAGAKSCQVHVNNNSTGVTEFNFNVSGTGAVPQITQVTQINDFGHIDVGFTSSAQTLTIRNSGDANLTITSSTLIAGASDFTASAPTGSQTVAPNATASWQLACKPGSQGAKTGTFRIVSDANNTTTNTDVALACIGDLGTLTLTPASHDFGGVAVNTTASFDFVLANPGNVPVTGITGALANAGLGYVFDAATVPNTLAAGATKTLTVQFKPLTGNDGGANTINFNGTWNGHTTSPQFTLDGDGLNVSFDVTPLALPFGQFRFDTAPQRTYVIKNTGEAPITFNQAFTADAPGTKTSEVTFGIKKGTTTVTMPQILDANEQLTVTVTLVPENRIGAIGGKVDVTTNVNGLTPKQVVITGEATAAVVATSDVDFGVVDIDGPPITKTLIIKNTGTADLDITGLTKQADGAPNQDAINRFTLTLPATTTIVKGGQLAVDITYKPTIARGPGSLDHFLIKATLTGALNGPTAAMINVSGRGIDRVFAIASEPVDFPPTFRNPGDAAPTKTITVSNNGEAVLKVTAVMVTGDPIFSLVDGGAVDIPGNGTHDFVVRFAPDTIGPATPGQIIFTTDDNAKMMGTVALTGTGIGRSVAFGPPMINVGITGVNIPTTVDILDVTNMDASTAFKIRAIELGAGSPFQIVDSPNDEMLPALGKKTFAIKFTPTEAGHFETKATLFLDQDDESQAEVMITGDAVFVEARGGGGCSAGGDAGSVLVLGLGLLLLRRRRAAAALAVVSVVGLGIARADGVDISVFEPVPQTTGTGIQIQTPTVGAHGSFAVSALMSYASNPLVLEARTATGELMSTDAVVERSSELQLGAAIALLGRLELGAHLPLYTQSGQEADPNMFSAPPVHGSAVGNLALHGKVNLLDVQGFALGGAAMVTVPTASKGQFTGSDEAAVHLLLLAGYTPRALDSRLSFTVNAGGVLRGKTEYANIAQQSGVAWGVGASVRILDPLWATAEVFGEATPSGKRDQTMAGKATLSPSEWLAGVRIAVDRRFTIGLAGGRGVTDALGTPEVRGVLSLAFVPGAPHIAPIHPIEPPKPDGDADGDGIRDSVDKCPNEPEDKDMFDDDDGCPDPDNDRDGIPDALDKCPIDPEDKDGYQDDDGCPDKDNDGDGIPDVQDKCPNEPEDKDGFQDVDGCPDLDNDHDGIPDDKDKCPTEPETINGIQDDDGCPDKGDSTILLSPDRIELLDPVTFTGTKLTRASTPLLAQVAATLRAHTEIVRVRVTVHVQPSADADADQAKSEKRAQVVRDWLVQWGIAATRVEARGFGGTKPLVPADRKGAAKINDRLELIILERK